MRGPIGAVLLFATTFAGCVIVLERRWSALFNHTPVMVQSAGRQGVFMQRLVYHIP